MGTPHSPKLQYYWTFTARLFSVIYRTLVVGILPLCREAAGVFYSSSWLGHKTRVVGVLASAEKQPVYLQPQPNGPQESRCGGLTPLQRSSRCILQPQPNGPQDTPCGVGLLSIIPLFFQFIPSLFQVFREPFQEHELLFASSSPSSSIGFFWLISI